MSKKEDRLSEEDSNGVVKSPTSCDTNSLIKEEPVRESKKQPKIESTPVKSWVNDEDKTVFVYDPNIRNEDIYKKIAGTKDSEIGEHIVLTGVKSVLRIMTQGDTRAEKISLAGNSMMQSLNDFQPKDAVEARLVTQAAALFEHGMDRLSRAGMAEYTDQAEPQVNMAIKLLRCHNETIETLNRSRRGGEQKVIVQHVNIDNSNGGKAAIVGGIINDQRQG